MVGLVTLVTIRVDSVTSTCLRSSFGDMRTNSAPMFPVSSGTFPGHSSTTAGLSYAATGPTVARHVSRETAAANGMTGPHSVVRSLWVSTGRELGSDFTGQGYQSTSSLEV